MRQEEPEEPEILEIPGSSAWWPYRDSNPSYGYDHVFASNDGALRDATSSKNGRD